MFEIQRCTCHVFNISEDIHILAFHTHLSDIRNNVRWLASHLKKYFCPTNLCTIQVLANNTCFTVCV